MSNDIESKLEERGYWRVEIRPAVFQEVRLASPRAIQQAIEKARVAMRGWDFPHIGKGWELPESQSWVGVETDWSAHVEVWRAYASGQFIFRGGVWTDWLDQHHFAGHDRDWTPKSRMPIVSTLWSITEFWEFAARYSQTDAGDENMFISIAFAGLKGRVLFGDHERRVWFDVYGPARMDNFGFSRTLTRAELIAGAAGLAIQCATELFAAFGYEATPGLLESVQSELFQLKKGA